VTKNTAVPRAFASLKTRSGGAIASPTWFVASACEFRPKVNLSATIAEEFDSERRAWPPR
jgi:hypothetical protein